MDECRTTLDGPDSWQNKWYLKDDPVSLMAGLYFKLVDSG